MSGSALNSDELTWRLKNTFLEVCDAAGGLSPRSPRASSDPGARSADIAFFAAEGAKHKPCGSTTSGGDAGARSESATLFASEGAGRKPNDPTASDSDGTGPEQTESWGSSELLALEEVYQQGDDVAAPVPLVAHGLGAPSDPVAGSTTSANQQVAQWLLCSKACQHPARLLVGHGLCPLPTAGSVGHSLLLCSYPCKDVLLYGHCEAGTACGFCHLPHDQKRLPHLDKKNRGVWAFMDDGEKFRMLLPILRQKVQELGMGSRAAQVLEEWRCDVERSLPELPKPAAAWSAERRRLSRCVSSMGLVAICTSCGPGFRGGRLQGLTERLLSQMRMLALAQGW